MTREELLNTDASEKTYVSVTPFISMGPEVRFRSNIYSTLDYRKRDLLGKIDTLKAIEFLEAIEEKNKEESENSGETVLWSTYLFEISYFVDSRLRTDKAFRRETLINDGSVRQDQVIRPEDVLDDVHCVTINYGPAANLKRKTFVVDLDDFARELETRGYETNFCPEGANKGEANRLFVESNTEESLILMATKDYGIAMQDDKKSDQKPKI